MNVSDRSGKHCLVITSNLQLLACLDFKSAMYFSTLKSIYIFYYITNVIVLETFLACKTYKAAPW